MSTIKLDASGDLAIEDNALVLLSSLGESTAQRLRGKLQTFKGEWHLDERVGVPMFEKVLIKNPNLSAVRAIYREVVALDPAVDSVGNISLALDSALRVLTLSFEATLNDGTDLVFNDFILGENL